MEFSFEVVQTSIVDVNVKRLHPCPLCWVCRPTSGYMTKTMYVYYIAMKIYVLVCTNVFSPFLFSTCNYYVTSFFCHVFHTIINFTKTFED